MPVGTPPDCALHQRAHLEMPPLVTISKLNGNTLIKRRPNMRGFLFGESLTLAGGDDERAAYGIPLESRSEVGRAAAPTGAKGDALPLLEFIGGRPAA
ncbi:MAG TPA: hypothetical protein VGT44_10380 [Ktedonobacteraceae bacterium]|nr:hypothetical protein [Ktedonobacteraceae bacterium]